MAARPRTVLVLSLVAFGCGGGSGAPGGAGDLELHDAGGWSIRKPTGWTVRAAGDCAILGVVLRDPAEPLRQIFYFGSIGPVYLRAGQRAVDQRYVQQGGFPIDWVDSPEIDPFTPEHFVAHWPDIARMALARSYMSDFPALPGLRIAGSVPLPNVMAGATTAQARAVFAEGARVGEAMLVASVVPYSNLLTGPATGWGYGHFVCAVTSPKGKLDAELARAVRSLDTFTVTDAFVTRCLADSKRAWSAVAQAGQTLREASDILWDGWVARSKSSDVSAESYTDAFRGVERVYDPDTGTVYEVPNGWYAAYDLDRGSHAQGDLQLLQTSDPWELWMKAVLDGSRL
jgi:hypothetical protein